MHYLSYKYKKIAQIKQFLHVARVGIEPTNGSFKGSCLTAWLPGNIKLAITLRLPLP